MGMIIEAAQLKKLMTLPITNSPMRTPMMPKTTLIPFPVFTLDPPLSAGDDPPAPGVAPLGLVE
jgi:hypothetical protein